MILPLLLALATQAGASCATEPKDATPAARAAATQCRGLALAAGKNWSGAAQAFEQAAALAPRDRAAGYWAQAGNAWLAGGDTSKAKAALDHALAAGTLAGLDLGEAQLDHARVLVAENDLAGARTDLNAALTNAPEDPLAWLLSATLARRMGDLPRAKADIAHALERASDDASVQLEAGNIAARDGDEAGARAAWTMAMRIAPTAPPGISARAALSQFGPIPSTVTR